MTSIFRMAAAALAMSVSPVIDDIRLFTEAPGDPFGSPAYVPTGWTGNTQGSHRDVGHARHLNRLARKARRQERLHRKH